MRYDLRHKWGKHTWIVRKRLYGPTGLKKNAKQWRKDCREGRAFIPIPYGKRPADEPYFCEKFIWPWVWRVIVGITIFAFLKSLLG